MAECPCIVLVSEALLLLGGEGWGGAECPCIVLVSEALTLLGGEGGWQNVHVLYYSVRRSLCLGGGGGTVCPCIVLFSDALPLLGGGGGGGVGGRMSMYCTSQ